MAPLKLGYVRPKHLDYIFFLYPRKVCLTRMLKYKTIKCYDLLLFGSRSSTWLECYRSETWRPNTSHWTASCVCHHALSTSALNSSVQSVPYCVKQWVQGQQLHSEDARGLMDARFSTRYCLQFTLSQQQCTVSDIHSIAYVECTIQQLCKTLQGGHAVDSRGFRWMHVSGVASKYV